MPRQVRLGILVATGLVLFSVVLFGLASRSFLLSDTFMVKARYSNVAGLQPGAAVHFQGVNVGRVESVQLPLAPGERIEVTMAINEEARPLIRQNTQAQIKSDGLVGNQIVVLVTPADPITALVEAGGYITGNDPFDLFAISDKALASVANFERAAMAFETIMRDIQRGEGTIGRLIYDPELYNSFVQTSTSTQTALDQLTRNTEAMVAVVDQATSGVEAIIAKIDRGEGSAARFLNDPELYEGLVSTTDTLEVIIGNLRAVTTNADNMLNWGSLGAFRFAELMEAGKHNWLFKRYFEERGYQEPADFELRERAIADSYKTLQERERELFEWEQRLQRIQARLDAVGQPDTLIARPLSTTSLDDGPDE
ncbi:MAG: MlaD family protein [Bacteroidota bacterium]